LGFLTKKFFLTLFFSNNYFNWVFRRRMVIGEFLLGKDFYGFLDKGLITGDWQTWFKRLIRLYLGSEERKGWVSLN